MWARRAAVGASHGLTHAKRRPASQKTAAWTRSDDAKASRRGDDGNSESWRRLFFGLLHLLPTLCRCDSRAAAWPRGVRACGLGVGQAAPAIAEAQGGLLTEGRSKLFEDDRYSEPRTYEYLFDSCRLGECFLASVRTYLVSQYSTMYCTYCRNGRR